MTMKQLALLTAGALALSPWPGAFGQSDQSEDFLFDDQRSGVEDIKAPPKPIAQEFDATLSYVGGAAMKQGNRQLGDVDEYGAGFKYVASPEISEGVLFRAGVSYDRFSFGLPDNAPLPNTLNGYSAIIGADFLIGDQWLMRVELQPGIYNTSSDIDANDFNMPAIIGASYLYSKDLQFVFGLSIDLQREYPVLPGAGIRWQFADKWVLNAIAPRPRLEYEINKQWTAFAGVDIIGGTYRSDEDFGATHGNFKLNDTPISYWELRTGAGFIYKPIPSVSIEVSGGYMAFREFDFHRADTSFKSDEGAPYAQVSVSGRF